MEDFIIKKCDKIFEFSISWNFLSVENINGSPYPEPTEIIMEFISFSIK